jgi:hypothetical protein
MKKSMKPKRAAQPAPHPPVLDAKPESPRAAPPATARDLPPRHKAAKGSR